MESAVRQIKIIRVGPDGTGTAADDELISEKTVSLYVDGRYDHAAVITGGGEKLWAAGNLKCRGLISSADDIEDISVNDNIIGVRLKRRRVPVSYTHLARFAQEKTTKFYGLTAGLAAIACFVALELPFRQIVNIIYGVNGYVGILLIFFMLAKSFGITKKFTK